MKQDNQLKDAAGHSLIAAQIATEKAKQKVNALERSKVNARRTSASSTSNQQSEVTEKPPALYQVPHINVPDNLHDVAKLVQAELAKIAESQSILLTLWRRANIQPGANCVPENMQGAQTFALAPWGWAWVRGISEDGPIPGQYVYGTVLTVASSGTLGYKTPADFGGVQDHWLQQMYFNTDGHIYYRARSNASEWSPWTSATVSAGQVELMRLELKAEIYAELLKLNPGFIVPVVIE